MDGKRVCADIECQGDWGEGDFQCVDCVSGWMDYGLMTEQEQQILRGRWLSQHRDLRYIEKGVNIGLMLRREGWAEFGRK